MLRRLGFVVLLGLAVVVMLAVNSPVQGAARLPASPGPSTPSDTPTVLVSDLTAE